MMSRFRYQMFTKENLKSVISSSHPELRNGVPALSINHGSGTLTLQLPSKSTITDRRWHRLDIISDGKVGLMDG